MEFVLRFLIGGAVVSLFAILGDILRPRSFAGLFGAAPSVALATVTLTIAEKGRAYAAAEAKTMIVGAAAFFAYAVLAAIVLRRGRVGAPAATIVLMPVWIGVALGLYGLIFGRP
jgi:uncharacterized membrane protein (GlpM family)